MSRFPVERGDIRGRECRSLRPGSHKCPVAHVAPDGLVGRHAPLPLSLGATGWSDVVVDACRTAHVREATRSRGHVALHELVERHAGAGTSLRARIRSDMLGWACRSARGSGATCSRWACRSARRVKCDMHRVAVSPERSCKATFTLSLVAPRAWVGRHAAAPWATCARENVALARKRPDLVRPDGSSEPARTSMVVGSVFRSRS